MPQLNTTRHPLPSSWLLTCLFPCTFMVACELEPKPIPSQAPLARPAPSSARPQQLTSQRSDAAPTASSSGPVSHEAQPALDALDAIPALPEPSPPSEVTEDTNASDEHDPTSDWGC